MKSKLRMTEAQYKELRLHLFPGDGLEAAAILLCGRASFGDMTTLLVHQVVLVPYDRCSVRSQDRVSWDASILDPHIPEIWGKGLSIVKVHSHTSEWAHFSTVDDESDANMAQSWALLFEEDRPHGSAVMLPSGRMFGRFMMDGLIGDAWSSVMVVGHDIQFWHSGSTHLEEKDARNLQVFGEGTVQRLASMRIGVVGCSGTGSPTIEQLIRLGGRDFVFIDPDKVEHKNLNRILHSTLMDAKTRAKKVDISSRILGEVHEDGVSVAIAENLDLPESVRAMASCDVVFGCVDSAEGRNLLNRLAVFYSLPYFDVGVGLVADGKGGIETISGAVQYFAPGLTSLCERGVFTMEQVRAEGLRRTNPEEYKRLRAEKYIQGVNEERPAVIGVNMFASSLMVHDFLSRLCEVRNYSNADCESIRFDLCEMVVFREPTRGPSDYLGKFIGLGDVKPLLDRPSLNEEP